MRLPPPLRALCLFALLSIAAPAQTSPTTPPTAASPPASSPTTAAPPAATAATASPAAALPDPESAPISSRQRRKAEDAYIAGARRMQRNDPLGAIAQFTRAAVFDPANRNYPRAIAMAREHRLTQLVQQAGNQRLLGHAAQADALLSQARAIDAQNPIVTQHTESLGASPSAAGDLLTDPQYDGAIQLHPRALPQSFHLRTEPATMIRAIAQAYGVAVVFDSSVALGNTQIRIDLDNVAYAEAMPIALMMDHDFAVPLNATSVIVARDTPENRQRLEPLLMETFHIPSETSVQINEISTLLKSVFGVRQVSPIPASNSLVVRAPEQTLKAIDLTLGDMLDGGSEVVLDMRIFSIENTSSRNIGITLPQTLGAYNLAASAQSAIAANQSIINQAVSSGLLKLDGTTTQNYFTELAFLFAAGLLNSAQFSNTLALFGGGIATSGIFAGGASLNFGLNSSDTRVLDSVQSRVFDGQNSVLRIGTRFPIATAIYSSSVPALPPSLAGATVNGTSVQSLLNQYSSAAASIPQFSYEDLGLTLKTTPTIQKSGFVTLKLDFKIEALAGGSFNTVPILNNHSLTSTVTVADGDSALIASNLTRSESNAVTGTPGLSEIPGFQSVPNSNKQTDTSRVVILITPHIVRRRSDLVASPRIAFNLPASAGAN